MLATYHELIQINIAHDCFYQINLYACSQKSSSYSSSPDPTNVGETGAVDTPPQPEDPDPFASWLPNFMTGDSSGAIPSAHDFALHYTAVASVIITWAILSLLQS